MINVTYNYIYFDNNSAFVKRKPRVTGKKPAVLPRMSWQKEEYSRVGEYKFVLPYEFLLITKLLGITPRELLRNFIDHLCGCSVTKTTDALARQKLVEYLVLLKPGTGLSSDDIWKMFGELQALTIPDLSEADEEMLNHFEAWKNHYLHHWYHKWNKLSGRIEHQ